MMYKKFYMVSTSYTCHIEKVSGLVVSSSRWREDSKDYPQDLQLFDIGYSFNDIARAKIEMKFLKVKTRLYD